MVELNRGILHMQDATTKTDCNKQSKNEINTKNQSRKLNGNPNHFAIGGSSSGGKYAAVKA